MPSGNPPDRDLSLYLVWSNNNELGGFGPRTDDISRLGLDDMRFIHRGDRGDQVVVNGISFAESQTEAINQAQIGESLSGSEVNLISTSTDKQFMVYLLRVAASYLPIGSTDRRRKYMIRYQMELKRTN